MSATPVAAAAAKPIGFLQYLESQLNVSMLEDLGTRLAKYWVDKLPHGTKDELVKAMADQATAILEAFDNKIPVLGQWADLPIVDWLERWAVEKLCEWAVVALNIALGGKLFPLDVAPTPTPKSDLQ